MYEIRNQVIYRAEVSTLGTGACCDRAVPKMWCDLWVRWLPEWRQFLFCNLKLLAACKNNITNTFLVLPKSSNFVLRASTKTWTVSRWS